jgi:transcriptional antiterminator RfaH
MRPARPIALRDKVDGRLRGGRVCDQKTDSVRGGVVFWSVVQSQPACETRAISHIERQGFTVYAPKEKIIRIIRGRKVHTWRWLFPRYLFVWIIEQWQRLFSTVGVSTVLMNGQEPAKLPDDFVPSMKARERNGLIELKRSQFSKGQKVLVTGGLFAGRRGIYQNMTSRQREIVLLEALGRVELSPGLLRA